MTLDLPGERHIYISPQDTGLLLDSLGKWGSFSHTVWRGGVGPSKGVLANIEGAGYTLCPRGASVG